MTDDRTILIVDDCIEDREAYCRFLGRDTHGHYSFLEADCAESALLCLQEKSCDLILLDFRLPGSNGLEFLEDLKQQQPGLSIPIIMLTGQGAESIAVEAMKWGVHDYLIKQHLKADVLQLAVRNVLQQTLLKAQLSHIRERQRLIATTALRIRQSLNLEEILNTAVAEVQQLLRCEQVAIYEFETTLEDHEEPDYQTCERVDLTQPIGGHCHWQTPETWMRGKIRAISMFCDMGIKADAQPQSNLVASITLNNAANNLADQPKNWGVLVAHQHSQQRCWSQDEQEILQEVAVQVAIAIQQAELLQQTQVALDREKELNSFKSQIIATVSHEYRTPLTAIWAAASTLKLHGAQLNSDRQARCLDIIEQKSKHLKQLVEDMLSVQKCESNQTIFQPVAMELLPFVSGIVEEQQEIAGADYELVLSTRGSFKGFRGDANLLRLIFSNLITNAVKYTPNGGNVAIYLVSNRTQVSLSVEDLGIGIPDAEQSKLFQQFQRGSNVDTIPGLGLGLAIARSCADLHGGTIELVSQPDRGTKITVNLPKKPELSLTPETAAGDEQQSSRIYRIDFNQNDSLQARQSRRMGESV